MPQYDEAFLTKRASKGGKDPGRKKYAEGLLARAQQGDQAAVQELGWRSGVLPDPNPHDKEGAWATPDAKNYGKMLYSRAGTGYTPEYEEAGDGSFSIKNAIGGILKTAAPFASLIPGVGIPLAAGIAAGGSALGGAMQGEKFNLAKTALAGLAGGAGSAVLGGQGYKGIGGIPGKLGIGGSGGGGAAGGGGGGWKDSILRGLGVGGGDGFDPMKLLTAGGAVASGIDAHGRAKQANRAMDEARGMATSAYQARQPIETAANAALMRGMGGMKLGEEWAPPQSEAGTMAKERMRKLGSRQMPSNPVLARAMG